MALAGIGSVGFADFTDGPKDEAGPKSAVSRTIERPSKPDETAPYI
jgi:hypothetical protein